MIKRGFQFIVVVIALVALPLACKGRKGTAGEVETQTIAPAAAQPGEMGTDAMTQTVELQDGRSEAEGGVLSAPTATTGTSKAPVTGTSGSAPTTATTRTQ